MKNYLDSIDREALRSRANQVLGYATMRATVRPLDGPRGVKARGFSMFDFAVFKICMLSFGLWLGACFAKFFKKFPVSCSSRLLRPGCTCSGVFSLMMKNNQRPEG